MTTGKVDRNGATTIARMNFSGNVGHATIFSSVLSTACCLVVGLGLGLDLVSVDSGYALVYVYRVAQKSKPLSVSE